MELKDDVMTRVADERELPSLLDLWTTVFDADASVFTCEYYSFRPEHRKTFVAEVDGELVSSVQLFGIPMRDEQNKAMMVGGIANVSTLPEFRGRGLAQNLLKASIAEMHSQGYGWSFLFTGRHSFYEQLGWRIMHRSYLEGVIVGADLPEKSTRVQIQAVPDLARLRALNEASFETPLSRIRGDLDWEFRIPVRIAQKAVFMSESAYAIVREDAVNAVLEEWGMPTPSIEAFEDLLVAATRWAESQKLQRLVVSAPILAEARQALESLFPTVRNVEESEAMVRPISSSWPMSRLISLFRLPDARFFRADNF